MDKVAGVVLALVVGAAVGWWGSVVHDADMQRAQVIACMDGDGSRAAYDACIAQREPTPDEWAASREIGVNDHHRSEP